MNKQTKSQTSNIPSINDFDTPEFSLFLDVLNDAVNAWFVSCVDAEPNDPKLSFMESFGFKAVGTAYHQLLHVIGEHMELHEAKNETVVGKTVYHYGSSFNKGLIDNGTWRASLLSYFVSPDTVSERVALAKDVHIPSIIISWLSKDPSEKVREAVKEHMPNASSVVLFRDEQYWTFGAHIAFEGLEIVPDTIRSMATNWTFFRRDASAV